MSSEVTVKQLASTVGIPVERLLAQLAEAGIAASEAESTITEQQKLQLLGYLRRSHGKKEPDEPDASQNRAAGPRRAVGEAREAGAAPKTGSPATRPTVSSRASAAQRSAKTVNVEVRRKRTFVKRDETPATTGPSLRSGTAIRTGRPTPASAKTIPA